MVNRLFVKFLFMVLLMISVPLVEYYRYLLHLHLVPKEIQSLYAHWLSPEWSPILYASSMYLFGSILGVIWGIQSWNSSVNSTQAHIAKLYYLLKLTLVTTLVGVLVWFVGDAWYCGLGNMRENFSFSTLRHDINAYVAVFQYILFWSILSYGCTVLIRKRTVTFIGLIALQGYELFWGMNHIQRIELVLPTAISRIPIALSYPVGRSDSWAADFPSLLASTPMTFTTHFQIVNVSLVWVAVVELIYILIAVFFVYIDVQRRNQAHELVQNCR